MLKTAKKVEPVHLGLFPLCHFQHINALPLSYASEKHLGSKTHISKRAQRKCFSLPFPSAIPAHTFFFAFYTNYWRT